MEKDPFKKYLKESESDKAYKGYAWSTAIGLQAADGLKLTGKRCFQKDRSRLQREFLTSTASIRSFSEMEPTHIPRKPGEQIEVDWAGEPAHITMRQPHRRDIDFRYKMRHREERFFCCPQSRSF